VLVVRGGNINQLNVIAAYDRRPIGLNLDTKILPGPVGTVGLRFATNHQANMRETHGIANGLGSSGTNANYRHSQSFASVICAHDDLSWYYTAPPARS